MRASTRMQGTMQPQSHTYLQGDEGAEVYLLRAQLLEHAHVQTR